MNKYKKKVEKYKKRFMFTQPIPPPLTMFHLIFNKTEESCGTFNPADLTFNVCKNLSMGGRKSCEFKNINNEPYIWHTHDVSSRFYPSFEDIRKVIIYTPKFTPYGKKFGIEQSLIFTPFGVWELSYNGPPKTRDEVNNEESNVNNANLNLDTVIYGRYSGSKIEKLKNIWTINNKIAKIFYDFNDGKTLDPEDNLRHLNINSAINKYIWDINQIFQQPCLGPNCPGIQITFKTNNFFNLIINEITTIEK